MVQFEVDLKVSHLEIDFRQCSYVNELMCSYVIVKKCFASALVVGYLTVLVNIVKD